MHIIRSHFGSRQLFPLVPFLGPRQPLPWANPSVCAFWLSGGAAAHPILFRSLPSPYVPILMGKVIPYDMLGVNLILDPAVSVALSVFYALEFQIFNNSIRKLALNKCSGLNVLFCAVSDLLLLTFVTIFSLHFLFGDMDQFGSYFIKLLKLTPRASSHLPSSGARIRTSLAWASAALPYKFLQFRSQEEQKSGTLKNLVLINV